MKKNKISKNWLIKQKKDIYFRKSRLHGYRSRSAFKLLEMNKKFKFIRKNMNLLDLGSSPGGWSQVSSEIIKEGKILAVDIKLMEKIKNVEFIRGEEGGYSNFLLNSGTTSGQSVGIEGGLGIFGSIATSKLYLILDD